MSRKLARLSARLLLTSLVMFSSACATNTVAVNECSWAKIITVSSKDVLTDETARQLLTHNETVDAICAK